jgi:hypothetical protein
MHTYIVASNSVYVYCCFPSIRYFCYSMPEYDTPLYRKIIKLYSGDVDSPLAPLELHTSEFIVSKRLIKFEIKG